MSSKPTEQAFRQRSITALEAPTLGRSLRDATMRAADARVVALGALAQDEELRDHAVEIRDAVLSNLDVHLERLAEGWEANGGTVFFAEDAREANTFLGEVADRHDVKRVVKSKSMVSEEIQAREALEASGREVIETDLGEWIIQLAHEAPSHIIQPAIHKTKAEVAKLFEAVAGKPVAADTRSLVTFARNQLRAEFLNADMGITGVNFGVSQAGAICIVSNEGNVRFCTSKPRVHAAVMGMERVVGTFDELAVMLHLLARSSTGQQLTQYTSLLFGSPRAGEADGPEHSYLLILDNGRSRILGSEYQSVLRCIRCGACLNVCPVFRQVGGHAYNDVYSGPIGAVLSPLMKGFEEAGELAHASTLCGACTDVCPVRIPLDDHLLRIRRDTVTAIPRRGESVVYKLWSEAWGTPARFLWFARLSSLASRVTRGRPWHRIPVPILNRWTKGRVMPGLPRQTFRQRQRKTDGS